jgi:L-ascorbate metabolism protein UlaG (beta-lactamase superfamily)
VHPYKYKNRFYNHKNEKTEKWLLPSLFMLIKRATINRFSGQDLMNEWLVEPSYLPTSQAPVIYWLGHATFLIQIAGVNILTDPVFDDLSFLFPRLVPKSPILEKLPRIDIVLISHNHRDHMDESALQALRSHNSIFLVPEGDKKWFTLRSISNTEQFTWNNRYSYKDLQITFLPAYHWSQRGLFDRNRSLWGSWMLESPQFGRVYFAGDTAYYQHFKYIAEQFSSIDVALMPIGPCEPRKFMKQTHLSAEEAGQAFLELGARHFVPMHWGTYPFGVDKALDPVERLIRWWNQNKELLSFKELHVLKVNQALKYKHTQDQLDKRPAIEIER